MKLKKAIVETVATLTAIGVVGMFGGEAEPMDTDTPVTESCAVTETVDIDVPETELAVIDTTSVVPETTQIVPETTQIVTETTQIVTEAPNPATEAPKPEQVLKITSVTDPVEAGAKATLTIKGKPYTEYNIDVIYKTTASKAQGLENKISSADGTVSWTWKVGNGTTPGTYTIYISGGGERAEIKFRVYD